MVFGKIDYLNLLPVHLLLKRRLRGANQALSLRAKRGVPSKINRDFRARRIDAAFISSIEGRRFKHVKLGIVAKAEVQSVLALPHSGFVPDAASATSNMLARLLGVQGRILIGDAALRYRIQGGEGVDLAQRWVARERLPFVFGLLCYHRHARVLESIEREMMRRKPRIPYYILKQVAAEKALSTSDIISYLERISYTLEPKTLSGLHRFWRLYRINRHRYM
ncbi:MAG: hypothetical protein JXK05_08800 [Campylobacterales bacterium]|nr:hypothetical protein [Campylobacterales bacterium]